MSAVRIMIPVLTSRTRIRCLRHFGSGGAVELGDVGAAAGSHTMATLTPSQGRKT